MIFSKSKPNRFRPKCIPLVVIHAALVGLFLGSAFVQGAPCRIPTEQPLPKIILEGETHDSQHAAIQKEKRVKQALAQTIYYAAEGLYYRNKAQIERLAETYSTSTAALPLSHLHGYDEMLSHGISSLGKLQLFYAASLKKSQKHKNLSMLERHNYKTEFFELLSVNRFVRKAVVIFSFAAKAKVQPLAAAIADSTRNLIYQKTDLFIEGISPLLKKSTLQEDLLFYEYLSGVLHTYVSVIEEENLPAKYSPKPVHLESVFYLTQSNEAALIFVDELAVKWRNKLMAERLALVYCEALRAKKNLHVSVGSRHIGLGLKEDLQNILSSRVPVYETNIMSERD